MMRLTLNVLNLWDPEALVREDRVTPSALQIITLPLLIVVLCVTFTIDVITLPFQLCK